MLENTRLSGCIDQIDVAFVEREATPRLLMKLSIQLYLADNQLSNTAQFRDVFGVDRVRSTVHNWVHKGYLQPRSGQPPDHVVVDETVIQLDDDHYWLYAAVDPDSNELLHTKLEPTRTNAFAVTFFAKHREKHDVDDTVFLVDGAPQLHEAFNRHGLDLRYVRTDNHNSVESVLREVKRRTYQLPLCFSNAVRETADAWLRRFAFAWNRLI